MTTRTTEDTNENLLKVNLPHTQEEYEAGNGEGVWVEVSSDVLASLDSGNSCGEIFKGRMPNDSIYYPALKYDEEILFISRGEYRPVAVYNGFLDNMSSISIEERMEYIRKIQQYHMTHNGCLN